MAQDDKPPHRRRHDTLGLEIEALKRKYPEPRPSVARPLPRPSGERPAPRASGLPGPAVPRASATLVRPVHDTPETQVPAMRAQGAQIDKAFMWAIVGTAVALGLALSQWPYARGCGVGLGLYLGAVGAQLVTAGWGALATWRLTSSAGHVIALVSVFWGIVLAAEQILPRVGYAATEAAWRCVG